jgi:inorganic triphosphatase YgiF
MAAQRHGGDEREVKLAVPPGFTLPPLDRLGDLTVVDRGDHNLHAVYWDTDHLLLAHAGVGVRHRNGVWTYKGRSRREGDALVREELEVDGGDPRPPREVRERLAQWVPDVALVHPVAHLHTVRRQLDVSSAGGEAELVHDRVSVRDGQREAARFEEVEVEFDPGSQALADRLVRHLVEHGGTVDTTAKYVRALRALGHDPPQAAL